jgi:hypothetical protein
MKARWVVYATPPTTGWVFPNNYFPRSFAYKKDATQRAKEARQAGATDVVVKRSN